MIEVLNRRRQEVVSVLIDRLGLKNKDFENTLNAQAILLEIADNEMLFGKLVEQQNLTKLIGHACDIKNVNQAYALHVLATIVKEYPSQESNLAGTLSSDFQQTATRSFFDILYSCMLTLKSTDKQLGEVPISTEDHNQAGQLFKRFGVKRMRALELLKQTVQTFSKYIIDAGAPSHLTPILKRQVVTTLLEVIETYEFSNVASQISI